MTTLWSSTATASGVGDTRKDFNLTLPPSWSLPTGKKKWTNKQTTRLASFAERILRRRSDVERPNIRNMSRRLRSWWQVSALPDWTPCNIEKIPEIAALPRGNPSRTLCSLNTRNDPTTNSRFFNDFFDKFLRRTDGQTRAATTEGGARLTVPAVSCLWVWGPLVARHLAAEKWSS